MEKHGGERCGQELLREEMEMRRTDRLAMEGQGVEKLWRSVEMKYKEKRRSAKEQWRGSLQRKSRESLRQAKRGGDRYVRDFMRFLRRRYSDDDNNRYCCPSMGQREKEIRMPRRYWHTPERGNC